MEDRGGTAGPAVPGLARGAAAVLLGLWTSVTLFRPFTPTMPQPGIDGSWVAAMAWAADRGLRWGVDIAFTYGPASTLVTGFLDAAYLTLTLPLLLATCLLFGASTALSSGRRGAGALAGHAAAAGLAAAFSAGFPDAFFLVLPLAPALLALSPDRPGRKASAVAAATALAVGAVGMAKMSFPLAALPLFALADAAAAARRRAPVLTASCLAGLVGADLLYGQRLADLPAFVRQQGEVVAGYGEAMALDGSRAELAAYLVGSAALVALASVGAREGPRGAGWRAVPPVGLAWVLLVLLKAGFVRQDAHTLIAWHGLALAAALVAPRLRPGLGGAAAAAAVVGSALLGLALVGPAAGGGERPAEALAAGWRILAARPAEQVAAALDLLRDPAGFAAARRAERDARWGALAEAAPLPGLAGGVDVIPSEQSRIIAAGLDYRPRPSFQEYSTYTPALIDANRAFLQGPRAPAWVLFGPEPGLGTMTLDRRYPNLAEGALWLDLLQLYGPERRIGGLVALRRRDAPAGIALGEPRRLDVGFDERVPVQPAGPGVRAVWATVSVRPTLLGRLVAFLYRPPPLTMAVRFADGHEQLYQYLSGIGAAGFVLSPRVDNASEFVALADGAPLPPDRAVTEVSFRAPPRMRGLLAPRIAVELRPVTGGAPVERPAPASAWAALAAAQGLEPAAREADAPPPSTLSVPVAGLSRLDLGYGLAREGDDAPGVGTTCFAILPADGTGRALWRRCLDGAAAADRAPQSVSIALPPGTAELALRTTCEAGCDGAAGAYWAPPP